MNTRRISFSEVTTDIDISAEGPGASFAVLEVAVVAEQTVHAEIVS